MYLFVCSWVELHFFFFILGASNEVCGRSYFARNVSLRFLGLWVCRIFGPSFDIRAAVGARGLKLWVFICVVCVSTSGHAVTVYGPWFKSIPLCDKRHILVGSCGAQTYGLCRLTDNAARSFAVGVCVSAGVHKCSLDASVRIYSMNERITFDCKCFLFIFYFLFNYFLAERKVDDVGSWRVMKWLH